MFGCAATGAAYRNANGQLIFVRHNPPKKVWEILLQIFTFTGMHKGCFLLSTVLHSISKILVALQHYECDKYKFCGFVMAIAIGKLPMVTEMQKAADKADIYLCYSFQGGANFLEPCTDRNMNRDHCTVRTVH